MKRIIVSLICLLISSITIGQDISEKNLSHLPEGARNIILFPKKWEGKDCPNFTFKTLEGDTSSISNMKGKVVLIDFWFINCPPCLEEMEGLNKLYDEYSKDVYLMGITYDDTASLKAFLPKHPIKMNIIPNDTTITKQIFGINAFPSKILVDQNGKIVKAIAAGREYIYAELKPVLDQLLKP